MKKNNLSMSNNEKSPEFYKYYPKLFHDYYPKIDDGIISILSEAGYNYYGKLTVKIKLNFFFM